jgi:hypothetical protein
MFDWMSEKRLKQTSSSFFCNHYYSFHWLTTFPQTMEVATARVYNWDISQKRKEEKEAGSA